MVRFSSFRIFGKNQNLKLFHSENFQKWKLWILQFPGFLKNWNWRLLEESAAYSPAIVTKAIMKLLFNTTTESWTTKRCTTQCSLVNESLLLLQESQTLTSHSCMHIGTHGNLTIAQSPKTTLMWWPPLYLQATLTTINPAWPPWETMAKSTKHAGAKHWQEDIEAKSC